MTITNRPTIALALCGSGNRTAFYIGFLETLSEAGIPIDYIAASSGGSIVASAYACGSLSELKSFAENLDSEQVRSLIARSKGSGGLYSLDLMEQQLRKFTKGLRFEEVRPLLCFDAVDIESGREVLLCMGDIARAARVSCTLPGIFEPVQWGSRTLIDGGLLTTIPTKAASQFGADIVIAVNMRGTRHLFTESQLNVKKLINKFKKILFVDEIGIALGKIFRQEEDMDPIKKPGIFGVLGRSLDLAMAANENEEDAESYCDLMITPEIPQLRRIAFAQFRPYYDIGRRTALDNIPKIKELIELKQARDVLPVHQEEKIII